MSTSIWLPTSDIVARPAAARPAAESSAAALRERLTSLDIFRGLTVAGMLLVNNPGSGAAVFPSLRHAQWNGWTPTDLVFPFFLFIVGITTHLSLSAREARGADDGAIRGQIVRRGGMIFLIGLVLNWFPFYQFGAIPGHPSPTTLDRVVERLHAVRLLGVLQRIGLAYMLGALLAWRAPTKRVVATIAVLLLGYWCVMTLVPVPGEGGRIGARLLDDPTRNLAAWVDRAVLDWTRWGLGNHIWDSTLTHDPEGVLSTLPAIGTVLFGVLAGRWIGTKRPIHERVNGLFVAGALGITTGLMWNWVFPINKNLWTSSFALFTAGVACVALASVIWLVDVQGWRGMSRFFEIYGTNPLIAFVGSELMAQFLYSSVKIRVDGHLISSKEWLFRQSVDLGLDPRSASLLYALAFVGVWYAILVHCYRKRVFIKV